MTALTQTKLLARSGIGRTVQPRNIRTIAQAVAFALLAGATPLYAGPTGEQVVAGQAAVSRTGANTVITQTSDRAAINWQSFSIGISEAVRFAQPSASSIALNRVLGQNPTEILGSLSANGQIFIVNPNGVLFGRGAQVDVGGLVASTLRLSTTDFMSGRYHFTSDGLTSGTPLGDVTNLGAILANGGYVALIGPQVKNEGAIIASNGSVALAAGDAVTVNLNGNKLIGLTVEQGTLNALADNKGLINADEGRVILTAKAADQLIKSVVNNTGVIEARTLSNVNGVIELIAAGGMVNVTGKIDASAPNGGNGGSIETSGNTVNVTDGVVITTASAVGPHGTWLIDPNDFTIAALTGGDITGAALSTQLGTTNIRIATATQGTAGGNGDIFVNGNVAWASGNSLTLNAERNIAFGHTSGIALNGGTNGTVNLAAGGTIVASPAVTDGTQDVRAGLLVAKAATGIGSSPNPLRTSVSNLLLINTNADGGLGGIYAQNTGNVTVAGSNVNGDINIGTANGAVGASQGRPGGAGGNISVGTVNNVSGLTTASGDIVLTAGAGAPGRHGVLGPGGSGGAGGRIIVTSTLTSGHDATLTAGAGGDGGNGSTPDHIGDNGKLGGAGGAGGGITLSAGLTASHDAKLTAGAGGNGGIGGNAVSATVSNGGAGGAGGTGGGITLGAGSVASHDAKLTMGGGGRGGEGGRGGFGNPADPGCTFPPIPCQHRGVDGNPGAAGSTGSIGGALIEFSAGHNLTVVGRVLPTSGSVSLKAGMAPGSTLDLSNGAITLANPTTENLTLQGNVITRLAPSYAANQLSILTQGSIGSSGTPLSTQVNRLALQGSDIFVTNDRAVTVDAISAAGGILLNNGVANDITLAGPISAARTGDAIRLAGRNFINQAGSNALSTPNGRWMVWSNTPVNDVFGGLLSGNTAVWSTSFNSANPTLVETGNRYAFRVAPLNNFAVLMADNKVKTYGDTFDPALFTYTLSSGSSGSAFGNAFTDVGATATINGSPLLSSTGAAAAATRNGGNGGEPTYDIIVNLNGATAMLGGTSVTPQVVNGLLTINRRALSVTADNKSTLTFDPLPPFTATYGGFAFADSPASLSGTLAFATPATPTSPPGTYAISPSGQTSTNYKINYIDGVLTVNSATLPPGVVGAISTVQVDSTGTGDTSKTVNKLITISGSGVNLPPGVE